MENPNLDPVRPQPVPQTGFQVGVSCVMGAVGVQGGVLVLDRGGQMEEAWPLQAPEMPTDRDERRLPAYCARKLGTSEGVPETRLCVFGALFASELGYIPKTDNDDTISSNRAREGFLLLDNFCLLRIPFLPSKTLAT